MLRRRQKLAGIPLVLCALIAGWDGRPNVEAAPLRAGVAAQNITTDRPTKIIHDPLLAKALVLDDGSTKVVIICTDLIRASETFVSEVRSRVRKELGIDEKNVLVNASHDHHTSGQTAEDLVERTVLAVKQAAGSMVSVKIGVGVGREERITINRRLRLNNGKHWTIRRANPSPPDSEVVGLGPMDPEIGILRVDRTSGEPLAVLYHFAGHPYGGVPNGGVTADFPGFASKVIEEGLGNGAVALFLQGAAGDITPVLYKDFEAPPPTERLGTMLGLSTLTAAKKVATKDQATIKSISETLELPRRTDIETRIKALEEQQEEILQFYTGIGCGTHGAGTSLNFKAFLPLYIKHVMDPDYPSYSSYRYRREEMLDRDDLRELDAENRKRVGKYLEAIRNMERLIRIRSNLRLLKGQLEDSTDPLVIEVQGMRIGGFVLVTFPGEPFAEVGLRLKRASPFEHTFLAAYSNGNIGYAPTADAYQGEAYEDTLTRLAPQWQQIYETKALDIIRRLRPP